jgi:RNase H-like domain found in reverse transcriptase
MKEATFCGRIVNENGMRFHPSRFETLTTMQRPEKACDLLQFTSALNWMRTSIPNYAETVSPLHSILESCYKRAGGRTKSKLRHISLDPSWGKEHTASFETLKQQLTDQVKLSYPKEDYDLVLCTDASATNWSGVMTQVPKDQLDQPLEEQQHEPLGFLSESFGGPSKSWPIVEKEAYAVVEAMIRFEHIDFGRLIHLYTDHANLVYIFDPYGQNSGIARHTASKLMRWAVKLSSFRYVIEALEGDRNLFPDLLTRWAVRPKDTLASGRDFTARDSATCTNGLRRGRLAEHRGYSDLSASGDCSSTRWLYIR